MLAALVKCFEMGDFRRDHRLNARQGIAFGTLVVEFLLSSRHIDCPCLLLRVVPTLAAAVANAHWLYTLLLKSHRGRRATV